MISGHKCVHYVSSGLSDHCSSWWSKTFNCGSIFGYRRAAIWQKNIIVSSHMGKVFWRFRDTLDKILPREMWPKNKKMFRHKVWMFSRNYMLVMLLSTFNRLMATHSHRTHLHFNSRIWWAVTISYSQQLCGLAEQGKSEGFESCDRPIVRKGPIWVKIGDVLYRVTLKFDGWPWKTIGHLSFAVSSWQHFIAISEFKLELLSGNGQFGSNSTIFSAVTLIFDVWPWKTIGHLYHATSSSMHHFVAIGEFKLELQSRNAQFGSKSIIF